MKLRGSSYLVAEPIFFGNIDPDNPRNHREYPDAPTCVRCGNAVRSAGFIVRIEAGDWILANATTGGGEPFVLGSECARRVPASHRRVMDEATRAQLLERARSQRAQRSTE